MDAGPTDRTAAEPPRRPARRPRPTAPPAPPPPAREKLQLTLDPEVKRWLEVQALGERKTISELVTELVRKQPTRHVLHTRKLSLITDQADELDQAEPHQAETRAG